MKNHGYSLIEVLLYIAILAIISVVLSSFFLVSVTSNNEHSARDDIAEASDDIKLALDNDITNALSIQTPAINASGTALVLVLPSATTTWSIASSSLVRVSASSTRTFSGSTSRIKSALFTVRGGVHSRLNATTTRVEYHIDIQSTRENLTRTLESAALVGGLGL